MPEVMNYPDFAKWNGLANPTAAMPVSGTGFGDVSFDDPAMPTFAVAPAIPAANPAFGDLNPAPAAPEMPGAAAAFADMSGAGIAPEATDEVDAAASGPDAGPGPKELDDDGFFSIEDEEVGTDFDALIAQASTGLHQPAPEAEDLLATVGNQDLAEDGKVDLLAQMLQSDGPDLAAGACGELATITEQIGLVVGGGEGNEADRLYEMGMVYLEMGMFNQACDSFELATADAEFSVRAHEMWGITLQRAKRPDEAIGVLARGLAAAREGSREQHGLLYHLGMAMENTGQHDEAIECFRTINDADPTYLDVGRRLAKLTTV
jgi:hypothetical protein